MSMRSLITLIESAQVSERYSPENSAFLRYMKDQDFDPYQAWYYVCQWLEEQDMLDEVSELLGTEVTSADELQEEEPDVFYKLDPAVQKECGTAVIDTMMSDDPTEAPSSAHMMLDNEKLLPRTTWLIHFSNDAEGIAYNGFRYGMDQMDRLGLTTYFTDNAKSQGGYNFAFLASGRYASWAASKKKYGRHAVIFQNSGVSVHHHADEEQQVVFHGADVDVRGIVYLRNSEDGWQAMSRRTKANPQVRALFTGDFDDCVKWVQANFVQYRRALTGF
jgi:hypothetical protein